jgi:hypothetical protein
MHRRTRGLLLSALVGFGFSGGAEAQPLIPPGFESEWIAPREPGVILNLAVAEDDSIAAGAGIVESVRILSASGEVRSSFETANFVSGVVFAPSGELFASTIDHILRITPERGPTILTEHRFHSRDLQGDLALRGDQLFVVGHFFDRTIPSVFPPLWTVDTVTGEVARFETVPGLSITAVAYDAELDLLIGGTREALYEIDPETGEAFRFASTTAGLTVFTTELITTNPRLGPVVILGAERVLGEPDSLEPAQLALHPETGDVYFGALPAGEVLRATRDGEVTRFRTFAPKPFGLAFHPDGRELLVGDIDGVHRIVGDFDSFPCDVAHHFGEVTLGHAGGSPLTEYTLTVTFRGPVVRVREGRMNRLTVCPGARVAFQAESTLGDPRCWIGPRRASHSAASGGSSRGRSSRGRSGGAVAGTLESGDVLVCSNRPDGRDVDRFRIFEGLSEGGSSPR